MSCFVLGCPVPCSRPVIILKSRQDIAKTITNLKAAKIDTWDNQDSWPGCQDARTAGCWVARCSFRCPNVFNVPMSQCPDVRVFSKSWLSKCQLSQLSKLNSSGPAPRYPGKGFQLWGPIQCHKIY